nr:HGGxSTG domain-containing protein [Serratia sp. root2]
MWRIHPYSGKPELYAAGATVYLRYPPPPECQFPAELAEQTCGAKTRAGTPCKMRSIYANRRCKLLYWRKDCRG